MKLLRYIIIFLCSFVTISGIAQNTESITIKHSPGTSTKNDVTTFLRDNSRQVHFVHKGINVYCDKAVYYPKENFIEAYSKSPNRVRMIQGDTITMSANYIEYSTKTELAVAEGDVILTEPQSTLTTEKLYFDRLKQQSYYNVTGKVVRDTSGTITSQIGRYYMNTKKYQFVEDVVLVNTEYTLNTERLDFFTESGHAYIFGPSTIVSETDKIYCERGFYDTNEDFGYFERKAKIYYNNRIIEGDSMYFNRLRNFASATNNITVTDTVNKAIFKGNYAEVWRDKDSMYITNRALAITVQEEDSIYMHSDRFVVTGPPEHRITRAFYNAKIYKSDLAGKADSIHVDHKTGLAQMINLARFSSNDAFAIQRKPVLWNLGNQMTGDTIHLISNVETEKLDSLKVFNNAFLVSRDTLSEDGYNQIKGKFLVGLFRDNEIYNVDIIKNAEVIYYNRNGKGELVGINKSKSGSINIQISDNNIDEIRLIQKAGGKLSPESLFPDNLNRLKGFDWRGEERPNSVEDLFKDDPPLVLKKIKGLDNYVPPEDFFDEDLKERIKSAESKDPKVENKAARNLPESKSDSNSKKEKPKLAKPLPSKKKASGN